MSRSAEKRGPSRLIGAPRATKLSRSRWEARSECTRFWTLEMGTAGPFDRLGEPARRHGPFDAQRPGDQQRLPRRRAVERAEIPERHRTELGEGAAVQALEFGQ